MDGVRQRGLAARCEKRAARRLELLARGRRFSTGRRRPLVPEELLTRVGAFFEPLFWLSVALWVLLSAGTLVAFASRERRRRAREADRQALRAGADPGALAPARIAALAADPATPAREAAPLARLALEGPIGARIREEAGSAAPWWRRIRALRILVRASDAEAPARLREALFSGNRPLAAAAAALLGQEGSRRSAEILVEALVADAHPSSRLATAIERNGSRVADLLRPRLSDPDARLRYWAAYLAARWPDEAGIDEELAALAGDPDPLVRKAAIQSMAARGGPLVRETAMRLRDDAVDFVRSHAARALGAQRAR